uniref:OO_Ba0013J05-OO_Ba0033A15.34 protein n=1 Tax=Oryza officinalis TaxID=4535 RepID=D0ABH7_9ORYZ|nr:OO_Ba0013J05-OO_Ba0033A15.34 [Oryza officinalis]
MAMKSEYRRMEPEMEAEEELDEEEWARWAEAQRRRRRSGGRYVFTCALFASLNAILLGYGQSASLLDRSHFLLPPPAPRFRSFQLDPSFSDSKLLRDRVESLNHAKLVATQGNELPRWAKKNLPVVGWLPGYVLTFQDCADICTDAHAVCKKMSVATKC